MIAGSAELPLLLLRISSVQASRFSEIEYLNSCSKPLNAKEHLEVDSHQVFFFCFLASPKMSSALSAKEDNMIYLYLYKVCYFFLFLFCDSCYRPVTYVVPFYNSVLRAPRHLLYCFYLHI